MKWVRKQGTESGRVLKSGFKLRMPTAKCHFISVPTRLSELTRMIRKVEVEQVLHFDKILDRHFLCIRVMCNVKLFTVKPRTCIKEIIFSPS